MRFFNKCGRGLYFSHEGIEFSSWNEPQPNTVTKSFPMATENANWEWNFFNGYFSHIVVEIEFSNIPEDPSNPPTA